MEEVKVIDLENGTYAIIDEINIDNIKYIYLSNENNQLDFCIRKIELDNNEEYLVKLDNNQEFDKAAKAFMNKHQQELIDFN